jgi:predicted TIM-barrel fold metal-dependent hydrolase
MPCDIENGRLSIRQAMEATDILGVSELSKKKIYEGNARRLLHL